jgi:sulfate adenylyltransferase subunit 2
VRGSQLIPVGGKTRLLAGETAQRIMCRYRTLGCYPCTGAVRSTARTVGEIIAELEQARHSERITRIIDHDQDGSMEQKKREGYF